MLGAGIDDAGTVVGFAGNDAGGGVEGFVASESGGCQFFPGPSNASQSVMSGINNAGNFVGWYQTGSCNIDRCTKIRFHGTLNGAKHDVRGAIDTQLYGINDSGDIVGWFASVSDTGGFLDENGKGIVFINYPGGGLTIPYGVDDQDQLGRYYVVGGYADLSGNQHGFIAEVTRDENAPPSLQRRAFRR